MLINYLLKHKKNRSFRSSKKHFNASLHRGETCFHLTLSGTASVYVHTTRLAIQMAHSPETERREREKLAQLKQSFIARNTEKNTLKSSLFSTESHFQSICCGKQVAIVSIYRVEPPLTTTTTTREHIVLFRPNPLIIRD
jgi:hypothetical protein